LIEEQRRAQAAHVGVFGFQMEYLDRTGAAIPRGTPIIGNEANRRTNQAAPAASDSFSATLIQGFS
jgi:hypothetical protein